MISDRTLIQGQENKFNSKDKKLVQSRIWPEIFNKKVDISKIQLQVIRPWIEKKILEYIGMEDEITTNYLITELESYKQYPCPKQLSINMTGSINFQNIQNQNYEKQIVIIFTSTYFLGFLTNQTSNFMKELWKLLLDAQSSPQGIPECLIQDKKDEILQKRQQIQLQVQKLESFKQIFQNQNDETIEIQNDKKKKSRSRSRKRKHSRSISKHRKRSHSQQKDKKKKQKKDKKSKRNHSHRKRKQSYDSRSSSLY